MKRYGRLSLFEILLFTLVCAVFLTANVKPRTTAIEWYPFSSGYFFQTLERGWPLAYQREFDDQQYYGQLEESDRSIRQAEFLARTPPEINSLFGLIANMAIMVILIGAMHFAIVACSKFQKQLTSDNETNPAICEIDG